MKPKTKKRIKLAFENFTAITLEMIERLETLIPMPFESKYSHQKRLYQMMRGYPPRKVTQAVYNLKRQGLVKSKKINNNITTITINYGTIRGKNSTGSYFW